MCLDAVVNGCASAALAAVGPMRFSLCRRVVYYYDGIVIQQFTPLVLYTSISPMKLLNCVGICIHFRYPGI